MILVAKIRGIEPALRMQCAVLVGALGAAIAIAIMRWREAEEACRGVELCIETMQESHGLLFAVPIAYVGIFVVTLLLALAPFKGSVARLGTLTILLSMVGLLLYMATMEFTQDDGLDCLPCVLFALFIIAALFAEILRSFPNILFRRKNGKRYEDVPETVIRVDFLIEDEDADTPAKTPPADPEAGKEEPATEDDDGDPDRSA